MLLENRMKLTLDLAKSGRRLAAIALLLLLAGCAATPNQPKDDPVARRAQARWDMVLERRFDEAYVYYSPGYRSTHPLNDFIVDMSTKRVKWTSATYRDKRCDKSRCTVSVDLTFVVPRPAPGVDAYDGKSVVEETWVLLAGEWWYVPEK